MCTHVHDNNKFNRRDVRLVYEDKPRQYRNVINHNVLYKLLLYMYAEQTNREKETRFIFLQRILQH